MWTKRLTEHPNDEMLLAYLDGEVSAAGMRTIRNHLRSCWKCRSILADLESQAEAVSRLLTAKSDSDIDRSVAAKEKFFRWRALLERQRKALFKSPTSLLLRNGVRVYLCAN
jgi:anti-sigma factor RsiW